MYIRTYILRMYMLKPGFAPSLYRTYIRQRCVPRDLVNLMLKSGFAPSLSRLFGMPCAVLHAMPVVVFITMCSIGTYIPLSRTESDASGVSTSPTGLEYKDEAVGTW